MSRKAAANHLLNFYFDDSSAGYDGSAGARCSFRRPFANASAFCGGGGSSSAARTGPRRADQSHFVLGHYRFALKRLDPSNALILKDPDRMVPWEDVAHVTHLHAIEEHACPICLQYPAAARITRCGHIFCLPCLLQYLDGATSSACPMCAKHMMLSQLKSVVLTPVVQRSTGNVVHFTLLHRNKSSVIAYTEQESREMDAEQPATNHKQKPSHHHHQSLTPSLVGSLPSYSSASAAFNRFNLCSDEDLQVVNDRDAMQIRDRLENQGTGETCGYVDERERESLITALSIVETHGSDPTQHHHHSPSPATPKSNQSPASSSTRTSSYTTTTTTHQNPAASSLSSSASSLVATATTTAAANKEEPGDEFHFYMSTDGQPIFVSGLNMNMLIYNLHPEEYVPGSNSHELYGRFLQEENSPLPLFLEAAIVQCDVYTQNEQTRRRFKHLNHLPISSEFRIAEISMRGLVSDETMNYFHEELQERERKRQHRKQQELRERKQAQKQHEAQVAAAKLRAEAEAWKPMDIATNFPPLESETDEQAEGEWPTLPHTAEVDKHPLTNGNDDENGEEKEDEEENENANSEEPTQMKPSALQQKPTAKKATAPSWPVNRFSRSNEVSIGESMKNWPQPFAVNPPPAPPAQPTRQMVVAAKPAPKSSTLATNSPGSGPASVASQSPSADPEPKDPHQLSPLERLDLLLSAPARQSPIKPSSHQHQQQQPRKPRHRQPQQQQQQHNRIQQPPPKTTSGGGGGGGRKKNKGNTISLTSFQMRLNN